MVSIRFVLVRPQHPGNIGATARVLANFGLRDLQLVQPRVEPLHPDAVARAVDGQAVLQRCVVHDTLPTAIQDCHLVVGTSRRTGKHRRHFIPVMELPDRIDPLHAEARVAIVLGSEEWGLTNEELMLCHTVVTIPSYAECPSLNLAHAVAILAYELAGRRLHPAVSTARAIATADAMEAMYQHLADALQRIGFFPHGNVMATMRRLRHLIGRSRPTEAEVKLLRGLARQILWAVEQTEPTPES